MTGDRLTADGGTGAGELNGKAPKPLPAPKAMSEAEYRQMLPTIPSRHETNEVAAVLTADQYFQHVRKQDVRPAFWKFSDVMATLDQLAAEPLREAERRFCTTVNTDTGDLVGAAPFIFIGWQLIHPGEEVPPHRHSSLAIYHILRGKGSTVVQEAGGDWVRYHWEPGDTLACPAWAYHAHYAEGDEDTLMYVVQDMPMLAASRTLMWEEPMGQENVRHMVTGTSPSWSVTRDPSTVPSTNGQKAE
jgi:gentisate 1,2-dioxygenase